MKIYVNFDSLKLLEYVILLAREGTLHKQEGKFIPFIVFLDL